MIVFTRLALIVLLPAITVWAALVVYFAPIFSEEIRGYAAIGLLATAAIALLGGPVRRFFRLFFFLQVAFVIWSWCSLEPERDRYWAPEYTRLPTFEVDGDVVTVRNVRNFDYHSATESTPRFYDKTVRLSELSSLDVFVSYWSGDDIAHIMVSFGFAEKDFIAVSIETRREANESYSTLGGFFRNYELMYVVADERDLIRVRTTYRDPPERVHLLRTNMALPTARRFFLDYAKSINSLVTEPEFYNTLTTNCTSQVLFHTRVNEDSLPYSWKVFLSGHVPEYLYDIGALTPQLSLEELMQRGRVNERSVLAGAADDYSVRIREGVPTPPRG